jgi:hypothetical protein
MGRGADDWVVCETEADARQMSLSLELEFSVLEGIRVGDEAAAELEACAVLFSKYGQVEQSRTFKELAKLARGEPSDFDNVRLD